ncbi:MAG: iron-sulfur cluster-binding protein [Acidobacteria bacterium]|nr:iron-sulfur cluster-binding protein [Acidobacteriota bacterium]
MHRESLTENFSKAAKAAVQNEALQRAVKSATHGLLLKRSLAIQACADWEQLRELACAIKAHAIVHLSTYLERFSENAQRCNARVFFAQDATTANRYIINLASKYGITLAVKSKSMVTEEIGLNEALQANGIEVIETDLGEYIIQLAGERPSHIIAPVIHKTRRDIARLFAEKLGSSPDASITEITQTARCALRGKFLRAQIGISGGNFAVAETGSVVIVENEGNARLTTSLPRIHVAIIGMEKLLPRWVDLQVLLQVLPRSATGQKMTSYVSILTGPKRANEMDGPQEMHIVILDNGRSRIAAEPQMRESLHCIRCGACLNACPVYRQIGGHAYGWTYSGPIGAVFAPLMLGLPRAVDLPFASSLCGECESVCPVKIPIPEMLLRLRQRVVESDHAPGSRTVAMKMWKFFMTDAIRYRLASRLLRWFCLLIAAKDWERVLRGWSQFRNLPSPAPETFRQQWKQTSRIGNPKSDVDSSDLMTEVHRRQSHENVRYDLPALGLTAVPGSAHDRDRFVREAIGAGTHVYRCRPEQIRDTLLEALENQPADVALLFENHDLLRFAGWEAETQQMLGCWMRDLRSGGPLITGEFELVSVAVGVTGADYALADTGTLVLETSGQRGRLLSLLPPVHVAILYAERVLPDLASFLLQARGISSAVTFVTGPSKTADIEQILTTGVHGPGELHILLVE